MSGLKFGISNCAIRRRALASASVLKLGLLILPLLASAKQAQVKPAADEEFFLISSVDAAKQQLVLKLPTEVTELVRVTDETTYLDEQGKPLQFKDLRAGDTVYVRLSGAAGGPRVARRIRKGPMTLEELHRRYFKAGPVTSGF